MSFSSKEALLLLPMLRFLEKIATNSYLDFETTLDAGILDFLLRIYVVFPAFSTSDADDARNKLQLLNACQTTLLTLFRWDLQDEVVNHPVCVLWTDCDPQPPGYFEDTPENTTTMKRCATWRCVDVSYVRRRMAVIYKGSLWKANRHEIENNQACTDIIEFTR